MFVSILNEKLRNGLKNNFLVDLSGFRKMTKGGGTMLVYLEAATFIAC